MVGLVLGLITKSWIHLYSKKLVSCSLTLCSCFSYDTRGRQSEHAKHWKDGETLDDRAYFRTITEPATLSIDNISERDEGDYRCRIDFLKSPTKNSLVRLTVIGKFQYRIQNFLKFFFLYFVKYISYLFSHNMNLNRGMCNPTERRVLTTKKRIFLYRASITGSEMPSTISYNQHILQ